MNKDHQGIIAKDGWVSFADILLALVCAVLYVRILGYGQDQAEDAQDFEARLKIVERETAQIEVSVTAATGASKDLIRIADEQFQHRQSTQSK